MPKLDKTQGTDSDYQRMTSNKKVAGSPQKNGEDIYREEGWEDNPEMNSGAEEKQRFQKQREHDIMMASESRKKKLGISKWDKKRKK